MIPAIRQHMVSLLLSIAAFGALASDNLAGHLSDNQRITSQVLHYSLQFRVYQPPGLTGQLAYPVLYVTDGQWYIRDGQLPARADALIQQGELPPLFIVFIDSRNPDQLTENRRNQEFMCNPDYARFIVSELIPVIEQTYPVSADADNRGIAGLSFGGLNAACVGLMASHVFHKVGMQSPASDQHVALITQQYQRTATAPLTLFLSAGTRNDNVSAIREFRKVLVKQGHQVTYREVREGHNWKNWAPLQRDMLLALFPHSQ
ncbi:alpha/beta hydrolase [Alteromonas sp. CYL-A6]|uniref:alpha/beta hydrolase n=1 Tax=Alteromonas nitratireducens TaxID=3390813 RepID=UPI0034AB35DD